MSKKMTKLEAILSGLAEDVIRIICGKEKYGE